MASPASVTSASALLQKASQQYLECRRKVSAKVDEVKLLESEIHSLFAHITRLGDTDARATKSVGRLELQLTSVEGDAPVDNAVVRVEIDPEYEEPEPVKQETVEEAAEEKVEEAVKEAVSEQEPAEDEEKKEEEEKQEASEEAEGEEQKTEEQEAEKPVEETAAEEADKEDVAEVAEAEAKEVPRRSVQWDDAEGFPLKVVFDPVQSREAVVTITIAPAAEDGEETEPVKEFRIPVASLFQTGSINRVYVLKKVEHVHVDKAALTEVADEDAPLKAADEAEKADDEEKKTEEEAEKAEEEGEKAEEEAEKAEEEAEKAEEPTEKAAEDAAEPVTEVPEAPHETLVAAVATVESEDKVVVLKEGKLHVQLHFTMSEIEKLSQTAIALSQQKQEAEAVLAVLEREALSLRTKYERLSASQRSVSAGSVVKPRSTLLGGRGLGGAGAAPRPEKSAYQKAKDSLSAVFTPQRTQVITSFAIFCGSVALFHFQGDNLLA